MSRLLYVSILALLLSAGNATAQLNKYYYVFMGSDLLSDNRYKEAIETLNALLRYNPDTYEAYFLRGVAKFNLGDFQGAERDFTLTLEKNPVFTLAYQNRAITRSRLGNYEDALNDFKTAMELRPDIPDPYYSRGVTYLVSEEYQKAVEDFNIFIKREDKVVEAYVNRGLAYLGLRDSLAAMNDFKHSIKLNPDYPEGYLHRGNIYAGQKKFDLALEDYTRAIACDSTYVVPYFNRAMLYYNELVYPMKALEDIGKVIELEPNLSVAYFNRAIIRTNIGDYNNALDDYDTVVRYSPNNVLAYYNRASLNAFLGNLQAAFDDYSKAIDLYPDFANAYLMRADVRFVMRDERGAKKDELTGKRKIAEHRSMLADSTAYAFTESDEFQKLLSFDSKLSNASFNNNPQSVGDLISMRGMFKFTMLNHKDMSIDDPVNPTSRHYVERLVEFKESLGDNRISFSNNHTDIEADSLIAIDNRLSSLLSRQRSADMLFRRAISQSLIKQYTNALNTYTEAIELDPTNPFLYINRSATRVEMIDFISSIDMGRQRLTIDANPSMRLNSGTATRVFDYDEAISDLTKAAMLYPNFAYTYYNRGNLYALSGMLPEAFEDYTRAIELNPYLADAYFNRGLVQIYMKDTKKGAIDLGKAGELGITDAYEVLKQLSTE